MKKIINITGMNCTHCVEKIKITLYGLPQIDDVNISLEENKAEVVFKEDLESLLKEIELLFPLDV